MPRDKFAAMAQRATITTAAGADNGRNNNTEALQQQQQQQQQKQNDVSVSPKGGKLAAMAHSQSYNNHDRSSTNAEEDVQQIQQQQQQNDVLATATSLAHDKLVALASQANNNNNNNNESDNNVNTDVHQQQRNITSNIMATAPPQRRDKFAALASRSSGDPSTNINTNFPDTQPAPSRNDKLAAIAGNIQPAAATSSESLTAGKSKSDEKIAAEAVIEQGKYLKSLKERLSKRRGILNSLDRAEELTCNLLKIAAKTTDALQDLNYSPDLNELTVAYRSTLRELHPLLTTSTEELIKPYQNHTKETKQSMYAARVEMRLAKERLEILKTFTELEEEHKIQLSKNTASYDDTNTAENYEESDRKRKR
mmetsp:Transcript_27739/g.31057  ORF Transcript_27739/g.31057 Transcript_27739/m.31057 type:complete len:367 (-) Transcript_27739:248-1348(-)